MIYMRFKERILHYLERGVSIISCIFRYIEGNICQLTRKPPVKLVLINKLESIGFNDFT